MTTDVELLPLPEPGMLHVGEPSEWYTADQMRAYARACVEANLAPLQTEVERLRAEVAEWKRVAAAQAELHGEAEDRADRLGEALLGLKDLMLGQVKWEPCDCGCPQQRTPAGPHSVTWLRAAQQVEIAIALADPDMCGDAAITEARNVR